MGVWIGSRGFGSNGVKGCGAFLGFRVKGHYNGYLGDLGFGVRTKSFCIRSNFSNSCILRDPGDICGLNGDGI